MDSETINTLAKKKYGEQSAVKGLDYLQKIVQLPFHIPTWKEVDMLSSIGKIISKDLEGSKIAKEFENNKSLIVKAVELNPRQVKRFINNIILAESVFDKPIDELIGLTPSEMFLQTFYRSHNSNNYQAEKCNRCG